MLREIVTSNSCELPTPSKKEAIALAKTLMGSFTSADYPDPQVFTVALCQVFSAYPLDHGLAVIDPLNGLPSKLKFVPKLVEVKEDLDRQASQRRKIASAAKRELEEREQRRKDRERLEQEEAEHQARQSRFQPEANADGPIVATESSELDRDAIIRAWNDAGAKPVPDNPPQPEGDAA